MEILLGKTAGFCYGVKRAVEGAKEEIRDKNRAVYCLGEIVHNKQVVNNLKEKGIMFIDDLQNIEGTVIIRAHGVKKEIYRQAKQKSIELKDYTCPNVLKIHKIAEEYSKKGYYILLCGSKNHPENIGTISYCGQNCTIVENEKEVKEILEKIKKLNISKLLLISQTTYSLEKFSIIKEIIKNEVLKETEVVIKNTICRATELRQKETEDISKKANYMIIIGGKNSSNTKKLYDIAKKNCDNCIQIETYDQLVKEEFLDKKCIGVMAGASTPQESIENIIQKIKEK